MEGDLMRRSVIGVALAVAIVVLPACAKSEAYEDGYKQGEFGVDFLELSSDTMDNYCSLMASEEGADRDDYYEGCVDGFRAAS